MYCAVFGFRPASGGLSHGDNIEVSYYNGGIHEAMEKIHEGGVEKNCNRNLDRRVCGTALVQTGLNSAASRWGSRAPMARIGRPLGLRVHSTGDPGTNCWRKQSPPPPPIGTTMTTIAMVSLTLAAITIAATLAATASVAATSPHSTDGRRCFRATTAVGAGEAILAAVDSIVERSSGSVSCGWRQR